MTSSKEPHGERSRDYGPRDPMPGPPEPPMRQAEPWPQWKVTMVLVGVFVLACVLLLWLVPAWLYSGYGT